MSLEEAFARIMERRTAGVLVPCGNPACPRLVMLATFCCGDCITAHKAGQAANEHTLGCDLRAVDYGQ